MALIKQIYTDFYRSEDLLKSKLSLLTYLFLFIILIVSPSTAKDIVVSPGSNISSIKQAVELSNAGDRIIIKKGFYSEGNIVLDKPVEITGENYPEINGACQFQIFTLKANNIKISGLVIKNSGSSNLNDLAGIRLENVKDCVIENNRLENNFFGISLYGCSLCIISSNTIASNAVSESSSGNGVHLWKCDSVTVNNNIISGHRDGIYFEFVTNSRITNNISRNNLRYGLHFMFSHYDSYEYNTFRNNGAGVAVMYTKHVEMIGNRFEDNWGSNSYGLLLKDINDSYIYKNTFNKNTTAVYMEGGARINVIENNFNENGWAMKILGDCSQDTIKHNNFETNTFDIATNSSKNNNFFLENYWDKYSGYDLNKDYIGDVPYRPVSLFSMMIERTPETLFLLRSFVADLLDLAEKVAPVFIPETLVDERPLMKQYGMDITGK
jgi:nitrous oxidase accessory protein